MQGLAHRAAGWVSLSTAPGRRWLPSPLPPLLLPLLPRLFPLPRLHGGFGELGRRFRRR
jgi:hypothetical protein